MIQDPVLQAIDQQAAALHGSSGVYVAYSGGLDSSVLLHAAMTRLPGRVTALHANHGLHVDAALWEARCAAVCKDWDVPFVSTRLQLKSIGEGLEAAARRARYSWFESQIEAGSILLMAHHQDDQAETLLLRLLRGAGPEGLAAMPSMRSLGPGALLRPLLDIPRRELKAYATARELVWIDDPGNADTRFDRNYLRQTVMPLLAQRWPGYRVTLSRAARQLRERNEHLPGPVLPSLYGPFDDPGFAIQSLPAAPALAALALRQWLRELNVLAPPSARLEEFLRQLSVGAGAQLCGSGWTLERYREAVYLYGQKLPRVPPPQTLEPGQTVSWPGIGRLKLAAPSCEGEAAFLLRTRRSGDRLPLANGHHKKLKTVFQEQGVPPWWRNCLPLLFRVSASGEELLSVAHLQRSPQASLRGIALLRKSGEITYK